MKVNPPKNTIKITNKRFQFMSYNFNSGANVQKKTQNKKIIWVFFQKIL